MNWLKLILSQLFGAKSEHIDGCNLFAGEYTTSAQFTALRSLYGDHPVVRIPFRDADALKVRTMVKSLYQSGDTDIMILLDEYNCNQSMIDRLSFIRSELPEVKTIELFNELPHMKYAGEQIISLQSLLEKTNQYASWIHACLPQVRVISMAPYNSMDETNESWGVTNNRILKDLILYTVVDIVGIHLYGDSWSKKMDLMKLNDNIYKWLKEAPDKKKVWVTECGSDMWGEHVWYYHHLIRLFCNTINPEKIIWYRQTIDSLASMDSGFALETRNNGNRSPLWEEIENGHS